MTTPGKTQCEHCGHENRQGALVCQSCYRVLPFAVELGLTGSTTKHLQSKALKNPSPPVTPAKEDPSKASSKDDTTVPGRPPNGDSTLPTRPSSGEMTLPKRPPAFAPSPKPQPDRKATLSATDEVQFKIFGSTVILSHTMRTGSLMIGRQDTDRKIFPDVDLNAHKGYENGVSRCHALLRREGRRLLVHDLSSSNGTWLNGQKLVPRKPYPVRSGDTIRLGTLVLQLYF